MMYIKAGDLQSFIHKKYGIAPKLEIQEKIFKSFLNFIDTVPAGTDYEAEEAVDYIIKDHPDLKDDTVLIGTIILGTVEFIQMSHVIEESVGIKVIHVDEEDKNE